MGTSKAEKIYALAVVLFLWAMLGSVLYYYFKYHDVAEGQVVNGEEEEVIAIDWEARYPFSEEEVTADDASGAAAQTTTADRLLALVDDLEYRVEFYTQNKLAGRDGMIIAAAKIENDFAWPESTGDTDVVFTMENGYLTYAEEELSETDITALADQVQDFEAYLDELGIPFLYVNAGSKVNPDDKQLSDSQQCLEYTNENADALLAALTSRGVDTLDFRAEMKSAGLDWYASYYRGDHHWTTTTQLWAARVLAERLNDAYGFSFDSTYFDEDGYEFQTYADCFLGGQGRALADLSYLEDFTLVLPKYETDYTITIPTMDTVLTGDYAHTLVDAAQIEEILDYTEADHLSKADCYYISNIQNRALTQIENHLETDNDGKKILLLQDSFGWYLSGYLASDVSELTTMYLSAFDGSVRAFVQEYQPDIVIVLYCERNIKPLEESGHTSMFDFR